jgi:hypothetical protein
LGEIKSDFREADFWPGIISGSQHSAAIRKLYDVDGDHLLNAPDQY